MTNDLRLIEDYLPIAEISAEASREKSVRKGHISTLHLWWARRPLVACRAAVYGALVPADRWVPEVTLNNPPANAAKAEAMKNGAKRGLNRAKARDFVSALCKYPGDARTIDQARQHILEAHAQRLSAELAEAAKSGKPPAWAAEFKWAGEQTVTAKDIAEGRAPRPRVLDMFAGGGAIPLEALRLGCDTYALDLNPVAHIIELCTLVYPQKYGKPDAAASGMTGKTGPDGRPSWGGLAEEVRYWGEWVVERVRAEIGDLYPLIPDPAHTPRKDEKGKKITKGSPAAGAAKAKLFDADDDDEESSVGVPPGYLMPAAYLWTRTVRCKNPSCGATVPLLKQSWLCKKANRHVALKMVAPKNKKSVRFEVVEAASETALGFDPTDFSKSGGAACPFCGAVADGEYVKAEGLAARIGQQFMAVACISPIRSGKVYLDERSLPPGCAPDLERVEARLAELLRKHAIDPLLEPIEINPRSMDIDRAGFTRWADIFTGRQQLAMMASVAAAKASQAEIAATGLDPDRSKALVTMIGTSIGKFADFCSTLCMFNYTGGRGVKNSFPQQSLPLVWDFAETNPFNPAGASISAAFRSMSAVTAMLTGSGRPATVQRGSALALPWNDGTIDAVITDPPYYDNVSYSNLSDFFYVWLRRCLGDLYPDHFVNQATPKKAEAIAAAYRHGGDRRAANSKYEEMMEQSFREAGRVLVQDGEMVVVYAHKTTLGWSTLVDALRRSGFCVVEAWPLDTERKGRVIAMDTAALASSIFLVARKRDVASGTGNYEDDVQPELEGIVRERVGTLWDMGITGADLVIACVGAGLRAFTKYERVEYASGESVPADKFLAEVEAVVLDTLMARLLATTRKAVAVDEEGGATAAGSVGAIDAASRFYVLWRYLYKAVDLDAGEAIIFANGLHVELDGQDGLSDGKDAMLEKKKGKYRLRDFTERGTVESVGLPNDSGQPAPLIDVLHRALYLMEHRPGGLREFLDQARPNRERLRLLAASLAGPGLSGKSEEDASRLVATTPAEQSALGKLVANWRALVPESLFDTGKR